MKAYYPYFIFLLIFYFQCPTIIFSQRPQVKQWSKNFGGSIQDESHSITQTRDGGFVIAGRAFSSDGTVTGNADNNNWLVKTDADGNMLWQKSYGHFGSGIYSIIETSDGGLAAAGMATSAQFPNSGDFWILKADKDGNIEWERTFGGTYQEIAYSIIQSTDGSFVVAGTTGSYDGDITDRPVSANYDYWAVKVSIAGNLIWAKSYGGNDYENARSVIQTADGGYLICGSAKSANGDVTDHKGIGNAVNGWLVKINVAGDIEWSKSYGGSGIVDIYDVKQTADGGFIIGSIADTNGGDVTDIHYGGSYIYDNWVAKTNATGVIQWSKSYGGTNNDYLYKIIISRHGGYIMCGLSSSLDAGRANPIGDADYWIVAITETGTVKWERSFGGTGMDIATSIRETEDDGLIMTGMSSSYDGDITGNFGNTDFLVIKIANKIATSRLTKTKFCAGDSLVIADTLFGVFNDNNTFAIELSDENGSFNNPAIIASFPNNKADSSFRITIPSFIQNGTKYRFRIVSNSPRAIYSDNGQDLEINSAPISIENFLGKDTSVCSGNSINLRAPVRTNAQYKWDDNSTSFERMIDRSGIYHVTVSNNTGCIVSDTVVVNEGTSPDFRLGPDTAICTGQTVRLQPVLPTGTYLWSTGDRSPSLESVVPGLYWLEVADNGCSKRDSISITTKLSPTLNMGADTMICDQQTFLLNVFVNDATYLWQDGSTDYNFKVSQAGSYTVKVSLNGCDVTAVKNVDYKSSPSFSLGEDTSICENEQLVLNAYAPGSNYTWNDNSDKSNKIVTKPGMYYVDVSNLCGNRRDTIIIANKNCDCKLFIPSAFSPNGDSRNDAFKPTYHCRMENYELKIFNRWGQIIFNSRNLANGWTGSFNNTKQPTGVYVWMLKYSDPVSGNVVEKKGTVLLVE